MPLSYLIYHTIGSVLDASGQADIIYLVFSKAFESVKYKLLLHKLQSFGLNENILSWFNSYLTNRIQRVVSEGHASDVVGYHAFNNVEFNLYKS